MSDFEYFDGECPYCSARFNDESSWVKHVDECEHNEPAFPLVEDEE